jgi:cell wall-associated NlpC family hydrolase
LLGKQSPAHWAAQCIGRPYLPGGDGPDGYDCWGFTAQVQSVHVGLPFPRVNRAGLATGGLDLLAVFTAHPELHQWQALPASAAAQDGDVVTCVLGGRKHIGTWLDADGGGVLHCVEPAPDGRGIGGVVFTSRAAMRIAGWGRLTLWRHRSRL